MSRLWTLALIAIALLLWQGYGCEQRRHGELEQKIKARETVIAVLAQQHRTDTVAFTRWRTRYRAVRESVMAVITDTIIGDTFNQPTPNLSLGDALVKVQGDSVPYLGDNRLAGDYPEIEDHPPDPILTRRLIMVSDSTIESCAVALGSCDRLRLQQDSLIRDLQRRRPSRFGCAGPLAATSRGLGLGVACGIRF
jgi:hypothetical protein